MLTTKQLNKAAATISVVAAKATKFILKYGAANQVADIRNGTGGKFESDARVKLIRDYVQRAMAHHGNSTSNSSVLERDALTTGIGAILAAYYRAGNCGENAAVAFCMLERLAAVGSLREWLVQSGVSMHYWRLSVDADHAFCVIRLRWASTEPMEIDGVPNDNEDYAVYSDPIICDPWAKDSHVIDTQNFFMNGAQANESLPSTELDALKSALSQKYKLDPSLGKALNLMELSWNILCAFLLSEGKNPSTVFQDKKSIAGAQRQPRDGDWEVPHPARDPHALLTFEGTNLDLESDPGQKQFASAIYNELLGYYRGVYGTLINYITHSSAFYPHVRN